MSKVRRGKAVTGSVPIRPTSMPKAAAIRPRAIDVVPIPAITVSASEIRAKISAGPMNKAIAASGAATMISTTVDRKSPATELYKAMRKAFSPLPCRVSGYPSQAVAAASGVPGVRSNTADTAPPKKAPLLRPTRNPIAVNGVM